MQRHFPQCSQRRRCFFSPGEEGIIGNPCWPPVGHMPPVGVFVDLKSRDLEEEQEEPAEEVGTLDSVEVKQPGVREVTVLTGPWWGCRFGWWSTVGEGAA